MGEHIFQPDPVALATELAIAAHFGQTRKGGEQYVSHVLRVAARVQDLSREHRVVALLHDVLEDTALTAGSLHALFGPHVTRDVAALTRIRNLSTHATYQGYIDDLVKNGTPRALQVKLADLSDNASHPEKGYRARYRKADAKIRAELARRGVEAGL